MYVHELKDIHVVIEKFFIDLSIRSPAMMALAVKDRACTDC